MPNVNYNEKIKQSESLLKAESRLDNLKKLDTNDFLFKQKILELEKTHCSLSHFSRMLNMRRKYKNIISFFSITYCFTILCISEILSPTKDSKNYFNIKPSEIVLLLVGYLIIIQIINYRFQISGLNEAINKLTLQVEQEKALLLNLTQIREAFKKNIILVQIFLLKIILLYQSTTKLRSPQMFDLFPNFPFSFNYK